MIVPRKSFPDFWAIRLEKVEQITAVLMAGVVIGPVQVPHGVNSAVVREEHGVCHCGVGGETGVLEDAPVKDELQEAGVGAIP